MLLLLQIGGPHSCHLVGGGRQLCCRHLDSSRIETIESWLHSKVLLGTIGEFQSLLIHLSRVFKRTPGSVVYRETVGPYGCECARKLWTECPEDTADDRCGLPFYLSLSPLVLTPTKLLHCWYCSGNTQIVTNVSSDILTQL